MSRNHIYAEIQAARDDIHAAMDWLQSVMNALRTIEEQVGELEDAD